MSENVHIKPVRPVSRSALEAFYASAESIDDCYAFVCHDNPRYIAIDWNSFTDAGYHQLTRPQQVINNLNVADGQIKNGGIEQLFMNWHACAAEFRSAVHDLGWQDLIVRFDPVYGLAFGSSEKAGFMAAINSAFQTAVKTQPWSHAAAQFNRVYREVDGGEFNDWYYRDQMRAELTAAIVRYLRANEHDAFEIR